MQQYFELVDWQGIKLPSAERRQRDSLKSFERSVEVWKDWIRLKKELATPGVELPPVQLLPAKRKKHNPDPTKKDASKEEFGRRELAGGNMWDSLSCLLTLLQSFDTNNPEMGIALNQPTFPTQAQALLSKAISEHTTQRNADGKSIIINKDRQVAPKHMPLGVRLAVNTHNMGGRFVESAKNARWSMSPQEAGDGLENILEFQVQIKGNNQRE